MQRREFEQGLLKKEDSLLTPVYEISTLIIHRKTHIFMVVYKPNPYEEYIRLSG